MHNVVELAPYRKRRRPEDAETAPVAVPVAFVWVWLPVWLVAAPQQALR